MIDSVATGAAFAKRGGANSYGGAEARFGMLGDTQEIRMKIGLVSDSHGKADRLRRALELLVERGAEVVVHCGDLGNSDCVRALGAAGVPAYAVAGNMDRPLPALASVAAGSGVTFGARSVEIPLADGRHLIATHGHDGRFVDEVVAGQQFAYLCHGHTHQRRDVRIGQMRVVNPGAIHHGDPHSAALLDTETDSVEFVSGF